MGHGFNDDDDDDNDDDDDWFNLISSMCISRLHKYIQVLQVRSLPKFYVLKATEDPAVNKFVQHNLIIKI